MNHAITRIVSFLVIATYLAIGHSSVVIVCSLLTFILYCLSPPENLKNIFKSLYRMKWFFLSIMIVYVLIDSSEASVLTKVSGGLKRISILFLIMLLVSWLINKTPRNEIISAIIFLLKPLRYFSISVETIALRIELIFQNIEAVRTFVVEKKSSLKQGKVTSTEIGKSISGTFFELMKIIDEKPLDKITIDLKSQAKITQWLFPIIIFIMLYLVQRIPWTLW